MYGFNINYFNRKCHLIRLYSNALVPSVNFLFILRFHVQTVALSLPGPRLSEGRIARPHRRPSLGCRPWARLAPSRRAGRPKRRTTRRRGGPPGQGAARVLKSCTKNSHQTGAINVSKLLNFKMQYFILEVKTCTQ